MYISLVTLSVNKCKMHDGKEAGWKIWLAILLGPRTETQGCNFIGRKKGTPQGFV